MSLLKALKNKIVDKTSDVISAPARAKADLDKETADYDVDIIKKNRAIKDRGFQASRANSKGVTGDTRVMAEYERIKQKYKK